MDLYGFDFVSALGDRQIVSTSKFAEFKFFIPLSRVSRMTSRALAKP